MGGKQATQQNEHSRNHTEAEQEGFLILSCSSSFLPGGGGGGSKSAPLHSFLLLRLFSSFFHFCNLSCSCFRPICLGSCISSLSVFILQISFWNSYNCCFLEGDGAALTRVRLFHIGGGTVLRSKFAVRNRVTSCPTMLCFLCSPWLVPRARLLKHMAGRHFVLRLCPPPKPCDV